MKTGISKKDKTTAIYFNESEKWIEVQTYNTDLKKRLSAYAVQYPEHCQVIDDNEMGELIFRIEKGRLSFRLPAPYTDERRKAASDYAKEHGITARSPVLENPILDESIQDSPAEENWAQ